ncbi:SWI SNF2 like ATpase and a Myb domain [Cryptosporidium bovis]|uniref:SWI SNF2 like ATpase and a Myb domain n=1 Tax=Cryptosporidium bovis TaxID=310047 RepID=UPI00351A636F|nr:SWI SNF2 like ATpase and a Myb domain [Cryptosporidium bovis]
MEKPNQSNVTESSSMYSFYEKSDNSPMSIEDPDEPSPSPINPITLKHTLRLASRVGIQNSKETHLRDFTNTSLLINLDKALSAVSINDLSFSPTPAKSFSSISNGFNKNTNKGDKIEQFTADNFKNKDSKSTSKYLGVNSKYYTIHSKNNFKQHISQIKNILGYNFNKNKIIKLTENEYKKEKHEVEGETFDFTNSFSSIKSFSYSRWIRRDTITDFINRYIPRFLIPAFKAIKSYSKTLLDKKNEDNEKFQDEEIKLEQNPEIQSNECEGSEICVSTSSNNSNNTYRADIPSKLEQVVLEEKLKKLLEATNEYSCLLSGESSRSVRVSSNSKNSGSSRKHFISEKEEDDMLMREVDEDEKNENININWSIEKVTEQPDCITGKMKYYQLEGLNWLFQLYKHNINGILADEMGLGKTLQTISILGFLKSTFLVDGPHIILTPRSTLDNWYCELKRWCPCLRVVKLHGDRQQRDEIFSNLLFPGSKIRSESIKTQNPEFSHVEETVEETDCTSLTTEDSLKSEYANFDFKDGNVQYNICLTTFEMAIKEKWRLQKISWEYLILDEAHRIKNEKSLLSEVVRLLKSKNRLLITGTPLQNNLRELWSLLNFLMPNLFSSSEDFESIFDFSKLDSDEQQKCVIKTLHRILRPFMLRRLKVDVERDLPQKRELYVYVGLSKLQKKIYSELLTRNLDVLNSVGSNKTQMLNLLMQLRKTCNHPYLFDGVEPGPPYIEGFHMVEASGKMVLLHKLLPKLFSQGSRVLLFSQMTRLLDIIDDYVRWCGYPYCRIDGSTPGIERQERIDLFNENGSDKLIFLLSTRAGGIGINLATADVVILFDSDFNPQIDLQAMDRAHRIGQKKPVTVYRFVTEKTVEERIVERAAKKLKLDSLIIQQGIISNPSHSAPDNKELREMIQFGAQEVYHTRDSSSVTDEDIETILATAQERTNEMNAKMKKLSTELDLQNLRLDGGIRTSMHPDDSNYEAISSKENPTKDSPPIVPEATWFELGERKTKWKLEPSTNNTLPNKKQPKPKLKGWRAQVGGGHDFQFFNIKRLDELEEIEEKWNKYLEESIKNEKAYTDFDKSEIENFQVTYEEDNFNFPPELKELNENQLIKLLNIAEEHMEVSIDKGNWPKKKLLARAKELFSSNFVLPRCNYGEALNELRLMFQDGRAWEMNIPCARQKKVKKSIKVSSSDKKTPKAFTDQMKQEMLDLLSEGFADWTKADFLRFCRAAETFGTNTKAIAKAIENKTFEEVKRYYNVFIKRYKELPNGERILSKIKSMDEIQNWFNEADKAINFVINKQTKNKGGILNIKNIVIPFKIKTSNNRFESFNEDEDKALLAAMYKFGAQSYNEITVCFKYMLSKITHVNSFYSSHHSVEFIVERCNEISRAAINYFKRSNLGKPNFSSRKSRSNSHGCKKKSKSLVFSSNSEVGDGDFSIESGCDFSDPESSDDYSEECDTNCASSRQNSNKKRSEENVNRKVSPGNWGFSGRRLLIKACTCQMLLDRQIQYWATVPIVVIVFCGVVLKTALQISSSRSKKRRIPQRDEQNINDSLFSTQRVSLRNFEFQCHISRSKLIRSRGFLLPYESFQRRKMFYCNDSDGYFLNPPEPPNPLAVLSNPDHSLLADAMKNQFGFLILNGGIGFLVSSLFSGFFVAYLPIPISYSFKGMLQKGVEVIPNISTSYLSALSFYFIVLIACGELSNILLSMFGFENTSNIHLDIPMVNQRESPLGNQTDYSKLFSEEIESLHTCPNGSILDNIEELTIETLN